MLNPRPRPFLLISTSKVLASTEMSGMIMVMFKDNLRVPFSAPNIGEELLEDEEALEAEENFRLGIT